MPSPDSTRVCFESVVIAAIYTTAGKIDAHIALLESRDPRARCKTIPHHRPPQSRLRRTAKNNNGVLVCMEVARESMSHLSAAARYHHLH
jgi:hypothetical protein